MSDLKKRIEERAEYLKHKINNTTVIKTQMKMIDLNYYDGILERAEAELEFVESLNVSDYVKKEIKVKFDEQTDHAYCGHCDATVDYLDETEVQTEYRQRYCSDCGYLQIWD